MSSTILKRVIILTMTIRWLHRLHNLYVDLVYRIFIVTRNLLFALENDTGFEMDYFRFLLSTS